MNQQTTGTRQTPAQQSSTPLTVQRELQRQKEDTLQWIARSALDRFQHAWGN